jgi:hypothetical protein
MEIDKNRSPIFVVSGLSRCGTTLLRLMLTAHSEISIPPESLFIRRLLQQGYGKDAVIDGSNRSEFMEIVWDKWDAKLPEWKLGRCEIEQRLARKGALPLADAIADIYWAYAEKYHPEARIWGDKNPSYLWDMDDLKKLFPGARFIVIVRDVRDVYLSSYKLGSQDRWNFRHFALTWNEIVDFKSSGDSGNHITFVKYEDLLTNPEKELSRLCAFLDIEFEPSMLEYHSMNKKKELVPQSRVEWGHKNTLKPVMKHNFNKWAVELPRERVEVIEHFSGNHLEHMGYERGYKNSVFSFRASLLLLNNNWQLARLKVLRTLRRFFA